MASLTLRELERWLILAVAGYHGSVHSGLRDRRDISRVWVLDPEGHHYVEVEPPILMTPR